MKNEKFDYDILMKVRTLSKCIKCDFNDRLLSYGLTGQQGRILFFIVDNEKRNIETHQNDIEERFLLSKSSVSEILSRMIKSDFVAKEKINQYCLIHSTSKGKTIVDEVLKHKQETIDKLFYGFDESEKSRAIINIDRMIENMRKEK